MDPTYRNMSDHTETIQLDYDPLTISYEELLDEFWSNHRAVQHGYGGRQYMSLLLFHHEKQKTIAKNVKNNWEKQLKVKIETEISPYSMFFIAEDYHQKYYLKRRPSTVETLSPLFPTHEALIHSTLAARLNGFVKGFGTLLAIKKEIEEMENLSPDKKTKMIDVMSAIKW